MNESEGTSIDPNDKGETPKESGEKPKESGKDEGVKDGDQGEGSSGGNDGFVWSG